MFSGLTNQISGWVANKSGAKPAEGEEGAAEGEMAGQENGEEGMEEGAQQTGGGVTTLAQGLMMKAKEAKDGIKEKASNFQPPNLQGLGNNLMQGVTNLIPGRKEEEVPTPPEPNPPTDIGGELVEGEEQITE